MNTQIFKKFVLDSWFDGMSAKEIANHPTSKRLYKHRSSRDLTRNIIIGIINRNGGTFKKGINSIAREEKISFAQVARDIEQKRLEVKLTKQKDKYRERKCLKCRQKVIMEKNIYLCKSCKESNKQYGDVIGYKVS